MVSYTNYAMDIKAISKARQNKGKDRFGTEYWKIHQVKSVEDSLWKI